MNPISSAPLDAHFRYRIFHDVVAFDSVDGDPQRLLGFDAQAFHAGTADLRERIHVDDEDIAAQLFTPQATATHQVANLRLRQANGRIRCVKCSYERSATAEGVILDLLLVDAKSLPRTLDDAADMANFRAMMENTDDYIFFKDRNHVLTGASQTLVALCDPAEHWTDLLGQTDYDIFPEAFADAYYRLEKQLFAGGEAVNEVQEYLSKEGRKGWVDNRKYPIRNDAGEIVGLYGIARDITEQKQREQALKASEQRFRTLFESTPSIAVQGYDPERRVIFWNRASEDLYGYSREEVFGRRLEDLIIPDAMRQGVINAVNGWLAGGQAIPPAELLLRHKEGTAVPVFSSHVMQPGPNGPEMYCIDIDLSQQKRAESRLALVMEATKVLIWELDFTTDKLAYDGSALTSLGLEAADAPDSLTGWLARVHADDLPRFMAMLEQVLQPDDTRGFDCEYRFDDNAGGYHWLQSVGRVVQRDAVGRPLLGAGYSINIDERKRNEHELQQREQYQRALLDNFPFAVWLKDTESRFLAVNQEFVQLFGQRNADELVGRDDFDIAPAELAEGYRADDRAVLASGKKKYVEEEIIDADGIRKWYETYKAPVFDVSGSVVGSVGFARDITERRAAALALQEMSAALATSRDLLQQVIDTAPVRVFWKDRDSRYLGCNPLFARDAGKQSPAELIGQDDFAMGWAGQAELYRADDREVMRTGLGRINYEEPQTTPQGKTIWLRTSKLPLRDAQGRVVGVLGLYDDITESKRAEAALKASEEAQRTLIAALPDVIMRFDREGRHLFVS